MMSSSFRLLPGTKYLEEFQFYTKLTCGQTFSKLSLCICVSRNGGSLLQESVCTLFTVEEIHHLPCLTHLQKDIFGLILHLSEVLLHRSWQLFGPDPFLLDGRLGIPRTDGIHIFSIDLTGKALEGAVGGGYCGPMANAIR